MKRPRFRNWAKWVGLVGCALIVAASVGSLGRIITYTLGYRGRNIEIVMGQACAAVASFDQPGPSGWSVKRADLRLAPAHWVPEYWALRGPAAFAVIVPLWIPLLALAIPTGFLWYRDCRPPPNHCQSCGYNLTGNVSAVCPECGVRV